MNKTRKKNTLVETSCWIHIWFTVVMHEKYTKISVVSRFSFFIIFYILFLLSHSLFYFFLIFRCHFSHFANIGTALLCSFTSQCLLFDELLQLYYWMEQHIISVILLRFPFFTEFPWFYFIVNLGRQFSSVDAFWFFFSQNFHFQTLIGMN